MPKYHSLRGMPDVLPEDAACMRWMEGKACQVLGLYGYREIRTSLLENTQVFTRSIGEDTDIVEKEMYSFQDRGGKNISLRPEGTASIIRSYIENAWHNETDVTKLFYFGPMFRGERPQKGRLRQFNQIGAEIIGVSDPYLDAELILSLNSLLKAFGIEGFKILINSLGCKQDRTGYQKALKNYLSGKKDSLCEDCIRRSETNVLRVLDCKKEACKSITSAAPSILEHLCEDCSKSYNTLKDALKSMSVDFLEKTDLVRGLDYYTNTIFEVTHSGLGSQDAIAAGGRYDNLTKQMGGPDVGATGYAIGMERLLLLIKDKTKFASPIGILVVPLDAESNQPALETASNLRAEGLPSEISVGSRSLKGHLRKANKENRKYVIIIGEDERKSGELVLKNMEKGDQLSMRYEEILKKLKGEYKNVQNA